MVLKTAYSRHRPSTPLKFCMLTIQGNIKGKIPHIYYTDELTAKLQLNM